MRIRDGKNSDPGSRIEKNSDPGWKKFSSGIQDKHPGSATLQGLRSGFKSEPMASGFECEDPDPCLYRRIRNTFWQHVEVPYGINKQPHLVPVNFILILSVALMDCCFDTLKKFICESILLGSAAKLNTAELHVQDADWLTHCSSQNIFGRHDCPL